MRVAGVATEDAYRELLRYMVDFGYRTVSQALGAALQEWAEAYRDWVLHSADPPAPGGEAPPDPGEGVHPSAPRQENR